MTMSDVALFLNSLPPFPQWTNGRAIRVALGWQQQVPRYWTTLRLLESTGQVETGQGQFGRVRRVPGSAGIKKKRAIQSSTGGRAAGAASKYPSELKLYDPFIETVRNAWAPFHDLKPVVVADTHHMGRTKTGGTWSRPDITCVAVSDLPFVPGLVFDCVTFEVKHAGMKGGLDRKAIYEALSHKRFAHSAYVAIYVSDSLGSSSKDAALELRQDASENGIGLIVFADPTDFGTWEEVAEPTRTEPDPRRLNDFLRKLSKKDQVAIKAAISE
jgi:hypothetical protein